MEPNRVTGRLKATTVAIMVMYCASLVIEVPKVIETAPASLLVIAPMMIIYIVLLLSVSYFKLYAKLNEDLGTARRVVYMWLLIGSVSLLRAAMNYKLLYTSIIAGDMMSLVDLLLWAAIIVCALYMNAEIRTSTNTPPLAK
jgi:hypothetical protein